jgi:hypothetical protein
MDMTRLVARTIASTALLATLAAPLPLVTGPAAAQLPTPVLENGAAGDGTTKPVTRGISLPIIAVLILIGAGLGLVAVTVLRRWDRQRYPDNHMHHDAHPDDRLGDEAHRLPPRR